MSGAAHFYLKYNGINLPYYIFLLTLSRFCTASSCADFTRGLVIVTQCLAKLTRHVAGLTRCLAELTRGVADFARCLALDTRCVARLTRHVVFNTRDVLLKK